MEEAIAKSGEDRNLRIRYGRALVEQERFPDAARELGRARELGASDAGTLALWANALWSAGDTDGRRARLRGCDRRAPPATPRCDATRAGSRSRWETVRARSSTSRRRRA